MSFEKITESNSNYDDLELKSSLELLKIINKEDQSVEYSLLDKNLENTFSTYHNMLQKTKTRQLDEASEYSAMDKNINQKLKNFIYNTKQ